MPTHIVAMLVLWLFLVVGAHSMAVPSGPIAFNQLVIVDASGNTVIRLRGFDTTGAPLQYNIQSIPGSGSLYQLSQVFSAYGYEPKTGVQITSTNVVVTGSNNRVYYSRPGYDVASNNEWGTLTYTVSNGISQSPLGIVTLVPPSGALVGSDFLLGNEGWRISGNRVAVAGAIHEPYSRGGMLNYYIYGVDDLINSNTYGSPDQSLWYFEAPPQYLGNWGIAYKGSLQFTLGAFSGNFSQTNGYQTSFVEIECALCDGPVEKGIKLKFPISALSSGPFSGSPTQYVLSLDESQGWLKDPQNSLLPWGAPSQCDMIQVLSRLSALRILGDWTAWYESVALDDVQFANTKGQLPLCAMQQPDASVCLC